MRRPTPALAIRSAVWTYDPLRCMICKAFITESENGVAAAQAELGKLFIAIRGHRQRSHCPSRVACPLVTVIPSLMVEASSEALLEGAKAIKKRAFRRSFSVEGSRGLNSGQEKVTRAASMDQVGTFLAGGGLQRNRHIDTEG
ncbi:hypothetical protein Pcinc_007719 [Petrolisthes cinctipes]|uniref:Uncharacterized protein n=1 Tax=Petrolisthes cinctipes TaxID=88211 RepID=A0AAE1KXW9_PETCI|nr:hypothetical protein Pcinc_007719 [Petrolisthes cinctipes]